MPPNAGFVRYGADRMRGDVGQQVGAGRCTDLVVDHGQHVALAGQLDHGAREVAAARGVDPAGAKDQVLAAAGADVVLAVELGAAVNRQRAGRRVFAARAAAAAVEDIVGAVVDEPGAERLGLLGQHARRLGVQRGRELGLALGLVHRRVRGGIDDDVGPERAHGLGELRRLGEVGVIVSAVEVE